MEKERMRFFDGIRGIMSIVVVSHHFIIIFYPELYYVDKGGWFAASPFAFILNGNLAVQYFFILSGFLTVYRFSDKKTSVTGTLQKMAKRYCRLLPVIVIGTFLAHYLMKYNLMYHLKLEGSIQNFSMLLEYNNFETSFPKALYNAFFNTFVKTNEYVGPFWTIKWEIRGYIGILILMLIRNKKTIYYGLMAIWFCIAYFTAQNEIPIILGAVLAEIWLSDNVKKIINNWKYKSHGIILLSIIGIYLAVFPQDAAGLHSMMKYIPGSVNVWRAIGVCILCGVLLYTPCVHRFFENMVFQFLGKISFTIYGIHWQIILSIGCFVFYHLFQQKPYHIAAIFSLMVILIVTVIAAWVTDIIMKKIGHKLKEKIFFP